ncbi:MAG: hypothetical protein ACREUU_14345, partial [Gammaproteobacteria bacterium]
YGASTARRFLDQGQASEWEFQLAGPDIGPRKRGSIRDRLARVNQAGKLTYIIVPLRPKVFPAAATLAGEEKLAAGAASLIFGEDVGSVRPRQRYARGYVFELTDPVFGFQKEISVSVSNEEFHARVDWSRTGGIYYGEAGPLWHPETPLIVLTVFAVLVFFVRRLHRQPTSLSALLIAGLFTALFLAVFVIRSRSWEATPRILTGSSYAGILLVLTYCALRSAQYYLAKTDPARLRSITDMFRNLWGNAPGGLAILRGVLLGLSAAGLFVALCVLAARHNWPLAQTVLPDVQLYWLQRIGTSRNEFTLAWSAAESVSVSLLITFMEAFVFPWILIVLPAALLRRVISRPISLLAAMAAVWMAVSYSLTGLSAYPMISYNVSIGLQGVVLALLYLSWDLLTLLAAIVTVETWLVGYGMLRPYAADFPYPLAAWFAFALFGLVLYFWPQIKAARRRAAELLE